MPISKKLGETMERSSWIRRMFDEGTELKQRLGAENVFDFTLGNPVSEPPQEVEKELLRLVGERRPGAHRYMPNAGYPETRAKVAEHVSRESGSDLTQDHVIMTCGAGGALNVILKALLDPGDEVVITAPYFAEYLFYADNHQGVTRIAQTGKDFQLDIAGLERAMGPKTRVLLLNSPNNPCGAIYPEEALRQVGELLEDVSRRNGRPVYLVMDEPYRKLVYDGLTVPHVFRLYRRSIVATSHSKDLCLPGERIGYIAINPENDRADMLFDAMTLANRILGFVNAPALFQRLVAGLQDIHPDMSVYEKNREILAGGLSRIGYCVVKPSGGFYIFAKSPVENEMEIVDALRKRNVLVVPGSGFGRSGHFRIAFCVEPEVCEKALPGFEAAFDDVSRGD